MIHGPIILWLRPKGRGRVAVVNPSPSSRRCDGWSKGGDRRGVSEYLLEFCDSRFAGSGRTVYRLLIGAVPFAVEAFPMAMPRGQSAAVELRGGTLSGDRIFALRTPADPLPAMFWPTIPARLLGETDDGKVAPGRRGGGGGGGRARAPVAIDPAFDLTMPAGQRAVKL